MSRIYVICFWSGTKKKGNDLLEWIEIAKGLGYEGKAAVKFAEAERNLEIELLDKDRAHQKAEADREFSQIIC